jgi:hypothetical protein
LRRAGEGEGQASEGRELYEKARPRRRPRRGEPVTVAVHMAEVTSRFLPGLELANPFAMHLPSLEVVRLLECR